MHIREIVLDGFKSYAQRTVIGPFDSHFSAITGLNGSGKSNILDAICFVLGITTLASVRVNNLQELIYKNGQAGVTKANVTIFFDNSDKTRCPVDYQQYTEISVRREISLGGDTKYSINGTRATGERVKGFFQSVGLNVNNPNFLIMQGRITQVIHMKPDELLSLVSETSGINTYETGKRKAFGKLTKKQGLLREIQHSFDQDLVPKLERARKEKEEYDVWARENEGLEALNQKLKCRKYLDLLTERENLPGLIKENVDRAMGVEAESKQIEKDLQTLQKEEQKIRKRMGSNTELTKQDEEELQTIKKLQAEKKAKLRGMETELKTLNEDIRKAENEQVSNKAKLVKLQTDLKALELEEQSTLEKVHSLTAEVTDLQTKLAAAKAGSTVNDLSKDIDTKLHLKQQELDRKQHELQQTLQLLDQAAQDIRKKEDLLARAQVNERVQIDATTLRQDIEQLEKTLESFRGRGDGSDAGDKATLEHQLRATEQELNHLGAKYTLRYTDPEPNFDRTKVKGRVIRLITLKNPQFARALEVGGGGGLFSVVVDTDVTAQVLLKRKTLGNVRFLPINKMQPRTISKDKITKVRQEFGDSVHLALDLVDYDPAYEKSIAYVLGSFFVCDDKAAAKRLAYSKEYREKAVTLEGDSYDPSGTITGGYSAPTESDLEKVHMIAQKEQEIAHLTARLNEAEKASRRKSEFRSEMTRVQMELEAKKRQLATREQLQETSYTGKVQKDLERLKQTYTELELKQGNLTNVSKELEDDLKELDRERRESRSRRGSLQGEYQQKLAKGQQKLDQVKEKHHNLKSQRTEKAAALESLDEELRSGEADLDQNKRQKETLTVDINRVRIASAQESEVLSNKEKELEEKKRQELAFNSDLQENRDKTVHLTERKEGKLREKQAIEREIQELEKKNHELKDRISEHQKKFPYVREKTFPREELLALDLEMYEKQLEEMSLDLDRRGTKVNKKVGGTLEDLKRDFDNVEEQKRAVEADSAEIEKVIKHLDDQKEQDLAKACTEVDAHLEEIFSSLLPGAKANLIRVEGRDGLEFKVSFSGVVKSNLNELSGGQRSLLALSFILSLLKCKPAPIYIFDEIDAALDLSHTQNIGSMVRRHFAESQFIVVSLKEGMFSNASVLFRTQFLEGRSVVERHELTTRDREDRNRSRNS